MKETVDERNLSDSGSSKRGKRKRQDDDVPVDGGRDLEAVQVQDKVARSPQGLVAGRRNGEKSKRMRSESQRENQRDKKKAKKKAHGEREMAERLAALTKRQAQAKEYLDKWSSERDSWKFSSILQAWLLKNAFDRKIVPKSMFSDYLVPYLKEMRGGSVRRLRTECEEITSLVEKGGSSLGERVSAIEKKGGGSEEVQRKIKILRARYKRAQTLKEVCDGILEKQQT